MPQAVPRKVETYMTRGGKDVFQGWLNGLADRRARVLIEKTVAKVRLGNLGQHKSVGEGVQEIVLDYGPGYRIYLVNMVRRWLSCFSEAQKSGRKKRSI
jgi:putative addiction module killer protein